MNAENVLLIVDEELPRISSPRNDQPKLEKPQKGVFGFLRGIAPGSKDDGLED